MTIDELITRSESALREAIAKRDAKQENLMKMRSDVAAGVEVPAESVPAAIAERDEANAEVARCQSELEQFRAEKAEDDKIAQLREQVVEVHPRPAYDQVARVGAEERTYRPDRDPKGKSFLSDVVAANVRGDYSAESRLARHMVEEERERGELVQRGIVGSGNFSGLVVPQYLTALYAPRARAGRPFANACRSHDLPESGNSVELSRITTGTTTAVRANETAAVSETDVDDTILSIPVQENAGSQSLSRRAVMRGAGVEDVTLEDLFSAYATTLDSTLLNQATTGAIAAATAITYTSASPTAAELYPKVIGSIAAVEAALQNQDPNGTAVVMHSRRWYWMQSQLSSTFPLIAQPYGLGFNAGGVNDGEGYNGAFRGQLPNGTPVIVDNNVPTNVGAGTEDVILSVSLPECHLWEDGQAPMMIRTDTGPSMKSNAIDIVVFGFFAYTFARQAHAQKISGTGTIAPSF